MRPTRSLPLRPLLISTIVSALFTLSVASAQPPNPFGPTPRGGAPGAPPAGAPKAPPGLAAIARVEGRPITQDAFDRMAGPYFQQVRAQLGDAFDDRMRATAARNVLEELIRRDVLMVIALRRRIPVTDQDVDRLLRQDPSFLTNGKFDPAKLTQFKFSPGSNYPVLLPHLRELAAAARLDSTSRARFKPTRTALREEWSKRHEQVRFRFLAFALRDAPLEPEATGAEQASFYARHPELFRSKPRANLRYLGLSLPTATDSLRASAEPAALARARRMTDSLRAGALLESLAAEPSEVEETGFINVPATRLPRLGSVPELLAALAKAETDTARRILSPVIVGNRVIISEIAGVQPSRLSPFAEVRAEVKRQADLDKRLTAQEADRRAWFAAHPDSFRTLCAMVTRVVMEDSVRAARTIPGLVAGWNAGRDVRALARSAGARVETLSIVRGGTPDSLFTAAVTDSLLADANATGAHAIHGPRRFGKRTVVWRMDALQPDCVPAFDAVRSRADQLFQAAKRRRDVEESREYFEAHRAAYRSGPRRVVDYIAVKVPPLDSVKVSDPDQRGYYAAHLEQYRREEEVHARHILILTRPDPTRAGVSRAEALADSLLRLIRGGADFADLARRFSQDPGSAPQGGDLGFFPRGRMVPEFNDTSFALKPGQVSGLVKTTYGYHIIKVEAHHEAGLRSFDEVRPTIQNLLAQAGADSLARRKAESLRRRIARGAPVAVLALESDSLRTSPPFAAGAPIASVGWVEGLFEELAGVPIGRWAPRVYRAGSGYLVVRNAQILPEGPATFEDVQARAIEDMRNAGRRDVLDRRIAAIRAGITAGATLDSLAAPYGGLKDSGFLTRVAGSVPGLGVEPRVIGAAFALEPGHATDTLTTAVGVTWVRTEEKRIGPGGDYEKDAPSLELELLGEAYAAWLDREKQTMKIEILRPELRPEAPAIATPGAAAAPKRGVRLR